MTNKNNKIDWDQLKEMPGSKDLGPKKFLILDKALEVISSEGLHALSITKLSKSSGLSKSLILYHYPKIEEILEDLLFFSGKMARYFIERNLSATPEDFEKRVAAMIKALFEWVIHNREAGEFFILMFHEGSKNKKMESSLDEIWRNAMEIWEKIFLESMRYKSLEEVRGLTKGLQHLVTGTLIWMVSTSDSTNYQKHADLLKSNVEVFLRIKLPKIKF